MDLEEATVKFKSTEVIKDVEPHVDLGNLLLEDLEPLKTLGGSDSEERIGDLVRDNTQFLINELWKLPTERIEEAVVAKLPPLSTRLPREKPLPKAKPPTRWQQFAKVKGIQHRKKDTKIWDETTKSWKPRWGYRRGNDDTKDWLIEIPRQKALLVAGCSLDSYRDFFGERLDAKKERVSKNELQRMRNLHRPSANMEPLGQSVQQLASQISRAKSATASVGKFTETLKAEKPPKNKGVKRNFAPNEVSAKNEKNQQLAILKRISSSQPILNVNKALSHHQLQQEMGNKESRAAGVSKKGKVGSKKKQRGKSRNKRQHNASNRRRTGKGRQ